MIWMKRWIHCSLPGMWLLISISLVHAQPVVFYVSPNGDDNAAGSQEQPWRTLQQVQSVINDLPPGSQILFERNGIYSGALTLSVAGSVEQPIVLGAYGTGNAPVLSGLKTFADWANIGDSRWVATCSDCASHTDILLLDGQLQRKARYPNIDEGDHGYLYFDAAAGRSEISDDGLDNGTSWAGGELVIRSMAWVLDRYPIIRHEGGTLWLGPSLDDTNYDFEVGYGYFLQNHPAALDRDGEWVFDAATRQITLYLTTDPNLHLIQTSSIENVLRVSHSSYLRIQDVSVHGGTNSAIDLVNCNQVEFRNVEIAYAAQNGLLSIGCTQLELSGNRITDHLSNGVMIHDCVGCTISGSVIAHIGLLAGMGRGGDGQYLGVEFNGQDSLFEQNLVEYIGYNAVRVSGVVVMNNVVRHFALVKVDGGGIYTFDSGNSRIVGNVVLYGAGSTAAIPWDTPAVNGIYLDDDSFSIEVQRNIIGYVGANGIVLHNTRDIRVEDNLIFDAGDAGIFVIDDALGDFDSTRSVIQGNQILNFSQSAPPFYAATRLAGAEWVSRLGIIQNNRYCNPLLDTPITLAFQPESADLNLTLDEWQIAYGYDAHSEDCDIQLLPYVEVGRPGANRVVSKDIEDWDWWSEHPFDVVLDAQNGGTLRAVLPDVTTPALLYTHIGETEKGQIFRVSFHAQASEIIPLAIYLQQSDAPWRITSDVVQLRLYPLDDVYTTYLTVTVSEGQQRLTLEFQGAEDTPDVALHTIAVQPVDAMPRKLEEFALLEVNTGPEPRSVIITDGFYMNLNGQSMIPGTAVMLPPYSGLILLRYEPTT